MVEATDWPQRCELERYCYKSNTLKCYLKSVAYFNSNRSKENARMIAWNFAEQALITGFSNGTNAATF